MTYLYNLKTKRIFICILVAILMLSAFTFSVSATQLSESSSNSGARATTTITEGTYYFKNGKLGNFMQVDDGAAPNYTTDEAKIELWGVDDGNHQKWEIVHVSGDYYKIISKASGLALSVQSGKLNTDEAYLVQEGYCGEARQHWTFTQTSRGSYVIRPKSGDSSENWCMAASDGAFTNNGRNVEQRNYTDNSDYKDEWYIYSTILECWHSDSSYAWYWETDPTLFYTKIDTTSTFYFNNGNISAVTQWENALDIDFGSGTETSADIKCYGATVEYMESVLGIEFDELTRGITKPWTYVAGTTTTYLGDTAKTIHRASRMEIYIANFGNDNDTQKEIIVHEYGHALGYAGHSSNSGDVMYSTCHNDYTLTTDDISHIKQFYDYFN